MSPLSTLSSTINASSSPEVPTPLTASPLFDSKPFPTAFPTPTTKPAKTQHPYASLQEKNCLAPFTSLLSKLNDTASSKVPPVTCIVSDCVMTFTLDAAAELGIPDFLFWTASACGFMGFVQYRRLIEKGLTPLKGILIHQSQLTSTSQYCSCHLFEVFYYYFFISIFNWLSWHQPHVILGAFVSRNVTIISHSKRST
jgi:hypothetical protein